MRQKVDVYTPEDNDEDGGAEDCCQDCWGHFPSHVRLIIGIEEFLG